MAKSDRAQVDDLVRTWDRVMAENPAQQPLTVGQDPKNPYIEKVESESAPQSTPDTNLLTAFSLIASMGDRHPAGAMMMETAEHKLPYTLNQLYKALEHARQAGNRPSQEFKEQLRGMIVMVWAWGYVIDRTRQLEVRDQRVYEALAQILSTQPDTPERKVFTQTAENKLEQTTGLLLTAIDDAQRKMQQNLRLFFTGALCMLYALANLSFGPMAGYTPDEDPT